MGASLLDVTRDGVADRLARCGVPLLGLVLSLSACANSPVQAPPVHSTTPVSVNAPPEVVSAAIEDAAMRTGTKAADIRILEAGRVTWSDGALGCPEPGMLYTQALVPGYRIVLDAGGQRLNYHAGSRGAPKYCPAERAQQPSSRGEDAI